MSTILISPFHSQCFGALWKKGRCYCATLGTDISFEPGECC